MAVTDFFAGEIATELLKQLIQTTRKSCLSKERAVQLINIIQELQPIIREIQYSGVELPGHRQVQLDHFSRTLVDGLELSKKVLGSNRWNIYKSLQLTRKMEKIDKKINYFIQGPMQAHTLADVHHMRFETKEQLDRIEGSTRRLEQSLSEMRIGGGGWVEEALRRREEAEAESDAFGGGALRLGPSVEVGRRKVKEMITASNDMGVIGICGMGGSGKTTLAKEVSKDDFIRSYFNNRVLFLTVSQSPNVELLKAQIKGFITGNEGVSSFDQFPAWNLQHDLGAPTRRTLIVLDDVWSFSDLDQLIAVSRTPGCKTLVVSRFKFPDLIEASYEVELLREQEAMTLFCYSAFGQNSIPPAADKELVKQVVNECKGLPLALKVIGASLRDQVPMIWMSARNRLARGEPICDSHGSKLLNRMAISVDYLNKKVKECFLDLGSFPEDTKIPLDVLINMWVEIHDIDDEEAFAILVELSNKNLITLVKDVRAGEIYSSYFEVSVTQHDVLRDLSLHLNNEEEVNKRKRLLMPRREDELPREWERNSDIPFNAQIVSVHTGGMDEMEWPRMEFPKAEVLILNFSSDSYFLPPFLEYMPKLRALIVINHSTSNAVLRNFSVFSSLTKLRSLWLERVCVPHLSETTIPLNHMKKVSLVLCKINDSLDPSTVDLSQIFPCLSELTIDHCDDLLELPPSICRAQSLKTLSITNCHSLQRLPADMHKLSSLAILRMYACPNLRMLPPEICQLGCLKYLDISQCVNLMDLPQELGNLGQLEKIDMRECAQIRRVPRSASLMKSLKTVICDEEVSWGWKDVVKPREDVQIQVVDKCFSLDWLDD
ncbi:hypothetical protein BT93_F1454 [Corymbia citriodora subsp. variegata]|nr:hypothetical protein BT93_F1454 [Corymbia citriodora subsp. variegata]